MAPGQPQPHLRSDQREDRAGRAEFHCVHGENDDEILIFSVLDMRPVDYITFLISLCDGVGLRYTDYVIPSGTGTRIVSDCASPSFVGTGEDLRDGTSSRRSSPWPRTTGTR